MIRVVTRTGYVTSGSALALLAAGVLASYPELVMLGLSGLAAMLVAGIWMLARPQITAVREIRPYRVSEGSPARGALTVTNSGPRRSPPLVVTETIAGRRITVPLPSLPAGGSYETTYSLPTARRGRYLIPALTIGHSDPLRLLHMGRTYSGETVLHVHPRVHHVAPVPIGGPRDVEGPTSAHSPQGGVAFHSLRDYQPGDDTRLIDWKSTARTGSLMVRHNVVPDEPRHLVVLDSSTGPYAGASFEDAVRVAASLCVAACRSGFPIDLRVTRDVGDPIPPPGDTELSALDLLSGVEHPTADRGLSALTELVHDVLDSHEGTALCVVTGQAAGEHLDMLASLLPRFLTVSLVQIGEPSAATPRGVIAVNAPTSERFAATWNQVVPP